MTKKLYRDARLYQNSDIKPKKNQIVRNCGEEYTVKKVSKCGFRLHVKGYPNSHWLNTGCSFIVDKPLRHIGYTMPEWLSKRIRFEENNSELIKKKKVFDC